MGMVTLHLVIGVGVFILPLFLLLFSLVALQITHLYIVIGAISFIVSILTTIVLVTKFVNQPVAHGFFSYSDTFARFVSINIFEKKSWKHIGKTSAVVNILLLGIHNFIYISVH